MKVGLPGLFLLFFVWVRFQVRCPIETPLKGAIHVEDDAQDDPTWICFSLQIGDVETSRDLMYIFIWKVQPSFLLKGLSSSKGTTIFDMVATTSRVCLWKPIGPLHIYTPAMLLFKMWWSFWSAKENRLCSQSDKNSPKTKNGNGRMVQWDCLPLFCSFVVHSNVPLLSHQRFSDDVAGVSPAAMEEWTQWMRKKKSCSALVWPSIRAKIQPWFDPQLIIVILFFVTFKGLISRGWWWEIQMTRSIHYTFPDHGGFHFSCTLSILTRLFWRPHPCYTGSNRSIQGSNDP